MKNNDFKDKKTLLIAFCEVSDERNNLLVENKKLKEENQCLIKEVSQLAIESFERIKLTYKLEAEVIELRKIVLGYNK